jgi:formylglycine-generating enzyme required for sulfatase activity
MVVIDPVTDGPGLNKWAVNEGLAISAVKPQTLLCFSTQPGVAVKAQAGAGPGLFAKSLASALRTPGLLPIQVFERVQKQVLTESNHAQSPMFLPFVEDPFYFVPPPKVVPAAVTALQPGTKRENPKDGLDYVWIPPGTFKMGCVPADKYCAEDEKPQHEVKISHGFWITRTEVTVGSYLRFADAEKLPPPKPTLTNPKWRYTAHPISKVNWADADAYCKWAGGSLPTEAQWEYAARGGAADQIYPWGNEFDPQLANTMNTRGSEKKKFPETLPVKYFLENPNKFGMFDVAGNVREWTMDTYDPRAYVAGPATDPRDVRDGKEKVARGGSFNGGPKDIRLSARDRLDPVKEATNQTGFRCILLDVK